MSSNYYPQNSGQNPFPTADFHPTIVDVTPQQPYDHAQAAPQYNIVVKRNDALYRTLSIINTILSIIGVLMIVATFCAVCYGIMMVSEVFETVNIIKNQQFT
jgi:hypothetical protein